MNSFKQMVQKVISENKPEKLIELALYTSLTEKHFDDILKIFSIINQISEISFSEETNSIEVRYSNDTFLMKINKDFICTKIETPQCLLFVILHELLHIIFGDLVSEIIKKDKSINKFVSNIVFDLFINRTILETIFKETVAPPIISSYRKDSIPIVIKFLCPPTLLFKEDIIDLKNNQKIKKLIKKHLIMPYNIKQKMLVELITEFYTKSWFSSINELSVEYMFNTLQKICNLLYKNFIIELPEYIFIGSHGDNKNQNTENNWLKEKIKKHIFDLLKGTLDITKEKTPVYPSATFDPQEFKKVCYAIMQALSKDIKNPMLRKTFVLGHSVLPFPQRKETFILSCGVSPILYKNFLLSKEFDYKKVHLYIDVSGSTQAWWSYIYSLILALKEYIGFPIYGFSTKVISLSLNEIKEGIVYTTGGTDFNCIFEHALENKFEKILIITDGLSEISEKYIPLIKKHLKVYVLFILNDYEEKSIIRTVFFRKQILDKKDKDRTWWVLIKNFQPKPIFW